MFKFDKTYAVKFILENGVVSIDDLRFIKQYGIDSSIEPDERIMALSEGMRKGLTLYALDAMELAICDERVSDEEVNAYYTYRERIMESEELRLAFV